MDPGPEGKLYNEDYDEDYDELESGNWMMDSYDSASNGKEALNTTGWPDKNASDCLASSLITDVSNNLIVYHPRSSLIHLDFYFCFASLFFPLLLFGFWFNISVVNDCRVWG